MAPMGTRQQTAASLGYSQAFLNQLTASQMGVPGRNIVVANLASLAARLVQVVPRYHATLTIQRAFRQSRRKRTLHQCILSMRRAADCAKVAQKRNDLVHAVVVLQRAWRSTLSIRNVTLSENLVNFHGVAKGWLVRRNVVRYTDDIYIDDCMCDVGWKRIGVSQPFLIDTQDS
ncbi:hypothetical protein K431DRAFT_21414 [Polychaeton citri CBS 116435]|uniref:Uncharacterized protein n=1 Tax=Polychaeton citri CBS 116435 TaxID=1314669 RepID=A0A9P4QA27_9PEZI|nr:hypothetical protein K431DRAFT_21414 [Polychaeton citri CBS 116435]